MQQLWKLFEEYEEFNHEGGIEIHFDNEGNTTEITEIHLVNTFFKVIIKKYVDAVVATVINTSIDKLVMVKDFSDEEEAYDYFESTGMFEIYKEMFTQLSYEYQDYVNNGKENVNRIHKEIELARKISKDEITNAILDLTLSHTLDTVEK